MKNEEEPSHDSSRKNPSGQVDLYRSGGVGPETTGSPSRPGQIATASSEKPASSRLPEFWRTALPDESNIEPAPADCATAPDEKPLSNRLVRTRMPGGVGGGRSNPPAYPIRHAFYSAS